MPGMTGAVLYEGPSLIDGEPVVAVLTGLARPSSNLKTGVMSQAWLMRADLDPLAALHRGLDRSVCGDCPGRGCTDSGTCRERFCYVNLSKAVRNVHRAWKRGNYDAPLSIVEAVASYRPTRMGAYGEPTAIPLEAWDPALGKAGRTGYTHRWRVADPRWKRFLMASVDTPAEQVEARNAGWRTFRVRLPSEPLMPGEVVCPASKEGGMRTTCERCLFCKGGKGASVAIVAHGQGARAYERWRARNEN